ncbi:MAG: alpha-ketoglutarate-dependent dioxygenase AlkB [Streptosporangiaceae bacterium]
MNEQTLFPLAAVRGADPARTGGLPVAADEAFSSAARIPLDADSWVDYVPGWLSGDRELMAVLLEQVVTEPRLTAEYSVIADAPQPVLRYLAQVLSAHYGKSYTRLWMNWYRDNNDGTDWHADRPANQLDEAVIPVLSLGASRRFLIRRTGGPGVSKAIKVHGGDLVVMGGRCQKDYEHTVPKQKQSAGTRLSLNFSTVVPPR